MGEIFLYVFISYVLGIVCGYLLDKPKSKIKRKIL